MSKTLELIKRQLTELYTSKRQIEEDIHVEKSEIEEIDKIINEFTNAENSPVSDFIPEGASDDFHRLEKNSLIEKKQLKEKIIQKKTIDLDDINSEIEEREDAIKYDETDNATDNDIKMIYGNIYTIVANNTRNYINKIQLARKIVRQDPVRAEMELSQLEKHISEEFVQFKKDVITKSAFELYSQSHSNTITANEFKDEIKNIIEYIRKITKCQVSSRISGTGIQCYPMSLFKSTLYMINELCYNSLKHSKADTIKVSAKFLKESIVIIEEDNGNGFDYDETMKRNPEERFGLTVLSDRIELFNGTLHFEQDSPGIKCTITLPV